MKLEFNSSKPNTSRVLFMTDLETKKKLTALRKFYDVSTGVLIKQMIERCYESLSEADK